jgi:hypothetical protein
MRSGSHLTDSDSVDMYVFVWRVFVMSHVSHCQARHVGWRDLARAVTAIGDRRRAQSRGSQRRRIGGE